MGLSAPRHFGGVKPSTSPSDPIIVSFGTGGNSGMLTNPVFVRGICGDDTPEIGTSNDEQYRAIRRGLLATPFETYEREIRQIAVSPPPGTDVTTASTRGE